MNPTYVPSRKVLAGGLAGLLTWALLLTLGYFNVAVPLDLQALLPTLIGSAISYLVPPSKQDVVRRLNDRIVAIAGADPQSGVSEAVGAAASQALSSVRRAP